MWKHHSSPLHVQNGIGCSQFQMKWILYILLAEFKVDASNDIHDFTLNECKWSYSVQNGGDKVPFLKQVLNW
jgi:hypothetical protein